MTKKIELTREELTNILQVATGNVKDFVMDSENFIDEQLEAINYIPCCTELKDKKAITLREFIDFNYEPWGDMYRCIKDRTFYTKKDVVYKHKEYCSL